MKRVENFVANLETSLLVRMFPKVVPKCVCILKMIAATNSFTLRMHVYFQEVKEIIKTEASKDENRYLDSFVIIIFGNPDNFKFDFIAEMLNPENAPSLIGKPKLVYVIGKLTHLQQTAYL